MQPPNVVLPLATLLLWVDSLPAHLYWLAMQKHHKYWRRQNIGACQDFTDFHHTLAVNISAHRRPIKNR
jgi:hypothetical protein